MSVQCLVRTDRAISPTITIRRCEQAQRETQDMIDAEEMVQGNRTSVGSSHEICNGIALPETNSPTDIHWVAHANRRQDENGAEQCRKWRRKTRRLGSAGKNSRIRAPTDGDRVRKPSDRRQRPVAKPEARTLAKVD